MAARSQIITEAEDDADIGSTPQSVRQNNGEDLSPVDILGGGTPQVGPRLVVPEPAPEFELIDADDQDTPPAAVTPPAQAPDEGAPPDADGDQQRPTSRRALERLRRKEGRERTFAENRQLKAEIARLAEQNRQFSEQMQRLGPQVQHLTEQQARNALTHVEQQFTEADRSYTQLNDQFFEAMAAGDTAKGRELSRQRDEAFANRYRYQQAVNDLRQRASQPPAPERRADAPDSFVPQPQAPNASQPPPLPPQARALMDDFMSEFPWIGQRGAEVDSRVVKALDDAVFNEGFDPATPEYWDELADRIGAYIPHRAASTPAAAAPQPRQPQQRQAPQARQAAAAPAVRRGPPAAAPGNASPPAGKIQVQLTGARREALEQAGIIDFSGKVLQPEKLKRVAAQYAVEDRASGASR